MKNGTHLKLISVHTAITAGILLIFSGVSIADNYQVTKIGDGYVYARGVNSKNNVAGYVKPNDSWNNAYAFLWNTKTGMRSLGGYAAYSINDSDQIAGNTSSLRAGVWENGSWTTLSGRQNATAINNNGQVVGLISSQPPMNYNGYRCDNIHNSSYITLPNPYPAYGSEAKAINNNGDIVSTCYGGSVFYYADLQYKLLSSDSGTTIAFGLNDSDQSVGYRIHSGPVSSAVYWDSPDSVAEVMGNLGSGDSYANAINNSGQAVGNSSGFAFLWTKQQGMRNLNSFINPSLGITLTDARDIGENGSIVAWGVDATGIPGSFLLTVPEPATLLLIGLSAAIIRKFRN